jgi:hypothetical protein
MKQRGRDCNPHVRVKAGRVYLFVHRAMVTCLDLDSNQGPAACRTAALPLSYRDVAGARFERRLRVGGSMAADRSTQESNPGLLHGKETHFRCATATCEPPEGYEPVNAVFRNEERLTGVEPVTPLWKSGMSPWTPQPHDRA